MDLGLRGKVAMVAASSKGIGFAVARMLAQEGAKVSISSSNQTAIQSAADNLRSAAGAEVLGVPADLRSADDIRKWYDATVQRFGGVDLLFANSGGPPAGGFLQFEDGAWRDAFELLVLSFVRISRLVIPSMKARGGGSIVFSTSSSVKEPIQNLTLSNVLRGSVSALSKTLAREFAADGIRVNQAVPGRIDTDRVRKLDEVNAKRAAISTDEQKTRSITQIPLGRYGAAEEFARGVVFLLSDAASYVTGATLQIDGGMIRSVM